MRALVSARACGPEGSLMAAPPALSRGQWSDRGLVVENRNCPFSPAGNLLDDRLVRDLGYELTAILTGRQVGGEQPARPAAAWRPTGPATAGRPVTGPAAPPAR